MADAAQELARRKRQGDALRANLRKRKNQADLRARGADGEAAERACETVAADGSKTRT